MAILARTSEGQTATKPGSAGPLADARRRERPPPPAPAAAS
jgi:hypothetical protein